MTILRSLCAALCATLVAACSFTMLHAPRPADGLATAENALPAGVPIVLATYQSNVFSDEELTPISPFAGAATANLGRLGGSSSLTRLTLVQRDNGLYVESTEGLSFPIVTLMLESGLRTFQAGGDPDALLVQFNTVLPSMRDDLPLATSPNTPVTLFAGQRACAGAACRLELRSFQINDETELLYGLQTPPGDGDWVGVSWMAPTPEAAVSLWTAAKADPTNRLIETPVARLLYPAAGG